MQIFINSVATLKKYNKADLCHLKQLIGLDSLVENTTIIVPVSPTSGYQNWDQALVYNCPLDPLINLSKLPLKTFTSAERTTASG